MAASLPKIGRVKISTGIESNLMANSSSSQYQVRFFTKQSKFSLPDTPFTIPDKSSPDQLNLLINSLQSSFNQEWEDIVFDFLISGELLRLPLQEHLQEKNETSSESVVDIEFIERYPAPEPTDNLLHDDWISAVKGTDRWILSGCYDNTLHLWSIQGAEHKLTIPGHLAAVKAVTWVSVDDPLSLFVSTSHDETAMLWQWNQASNAVECVLVCKGHTRSVDCVDADVEQAKFATGSYDRMMKIWSAEVNGETEGFYEETEESCRKKMKTEGARTRYRSPLATLSGHNEAITGVQWTGINEVLTSSLDNTLRLWDLEIGGLKGQMNGSKAVLDVAYSKLSHHVITASADRHIRLWDPRTKEGNVVKNAFTSHTGWVSCVRWSPTDEHLFVSGSYDSILKLWDTRCSKASLYDMTGQEDKILCCDWSTSNHVISGGADNHVKVYKTKEMGTSNLSL